MAAIKAKKAGNIDGYISLTRKSNLTHGSDQGKKSGKYRRVYFGLS